MKINVPLLLFLFWGTGVPCFACTVFYAADDETVLGGNNEDYSDPNTGFFLYPAEKGKYGWIKFGYMGGWPQGGMNDQGLFWDATACPSLDMPYSEANKIKYDGPLMQKVMQECSTVQEALAVFENYYCVDQYKGQYLIGDQTGASAIIEGDNFIIKENSYQVLTNFYQSHPDMGGYPCWRYETAVSMLQNESTISTHLFGAILSATHQEGRYPTQYSNIYDLKHGIVYLFYMHNFEEFVQINLEESLAKGEKSFPIKPLFSQIKLLGPSSESTVDPSRVTFEWQGDKNSQYDLLYATDPNFSDCNTVPVKSTQFSAGLAAPVALLVICLLILNGKRRGVWRSYIFFLWLFILLFALIDCADKVSAPDQQNNTHTFRAAMDNLQTNRTYYWKIVAKTQEKSDYTSESIVRTFHTL